MATALAIWSEDNRDAPPFGWRFIVPLIIGCLLNPVNSSIIATALVPIAKAFGIPVGQTAILVVSVYIAAAIAQPVMGKIAAQFGPRRIFQFGLVLVMAGGLIGASAVNMAMLIAARIIIGIGTSAGYPAAMLLIRRRATQAGVAPGSVFGLLSIAAQITVALGLPMGGVLVGLAGWRIVFFVNVPIALVTYIMARLFMAPDPPMAQRLNLRQIATAVDLTGILLFGGMVGALLIFLLRLPQLNWIPLTISVALMIALIAWERRTADPFLDVRMLASNWGLRFTYLRTVCMGISTYCLLYGVTQWLQEGKGLSATHAGLVMLPMTAVSILVTRPVSRRNLVRTPIVVGAFITLSVAIGLRMMGVDTAVPYIVLVTLAFGFTVAMTGVGNQGALYGQSPASQMGTSAGLLRTSNYFGGILSSSIIGVAYAHGVTDGGLHNIANILIGVSSVLVLITVTDRSLPRFILVEPFDGPAASPTTAG